MVCHCWMCPNLVRWEHDGQLLEWLWLEVTCRFHWEDEQLLPCFTWGRKVGVWWSSCFKAIPHLSMGQVDKHLLQKVQHILASGFGHFQPSWWPGDPVTVTLVLVRRSSPAYQSTHPPASIEAQPAKDSQPRSKHRFPTKKCKKLLNDVEPWTIVKKLVKNSPNKKPRNQSRSILRNQAARRISLLLGPTRWSLQRPEIPWRLSSRERLDGRWFWPMTSFVWVALGASIHYSYKIIWEVDHLSQ